MHFKMRKKFEKKTNKIRRKLNVHLKDTQHHGDWENRNQNHRDCCGLNRNVPQKLFCLDTWSPVGNKAIEHLQNGALLEEVHH